MVVNRDKWCLFDASGWLFSLRFLGRTPREHYFKWQCTSKWSQLSDLRTALRALPKPQQLERQNESRGVGVSLHPCVLSASQGHWASPVTARWASWRGCGTLALEGCLMPGRTEPFLSWTKRFQVVLGHRVTVRTRFLAKWFLFLTSLSKHPNRSFAMGSYLNPLLKQIFN